MSVFFGKCFFGVLVSVWCVCERVFACVVCVCFCASL